MIKRLAILGLGLIGGSLAKGLKERGAVVEVVGWGRRESSLQKGVELGVIDRFTLDLEEAVRGADIAVIATPTLIAEKVLESLAGIDLGDTIITDGASVKGNLYRAAQRIFDGKVPANLVLGHPIAGSEQSGVTAAQADLYVNHRVILTPTEETSPDALQCVTEMWQAVEAEVVSMPVDEHDEILAATSHLPHVLAYSLVDALAGQQGNQDIFRFAAGGFRDFTRIASSDPTMWHEISLANRDALLKMIDLFSDNLQRLRGAIEAERSDEILETYGRAKEARDHFTELLAKQNRTTITDE